MSNTTQHDCVFKALQDDERLVYGEVYSPMRPDSDGDIMDAETIKKMAHDFMRKQKLDQIDVQHDNNLNPGASVVESFIARKDDPIFIEGSWVVGVHIPDDETWNKVKKGEINGFSIEAMVTKTPQTLEVEMPPIVNGKTTDSSDHNHDFFVSFDATGKFMGGRTAIAKGHFHTIRAGTITDDEQGHNHKFSFVENTYHSPTQMEAIMKAAADCGVYPNGIAPEVQVIAAVESVIETPAATEVTVNETVEALKADFPLAKEKGANTSNHSEDKETTEGDGDADDVKPKKKFKLAVKEAVAEVLKSMGFTPELVQKDWAKWNEDKKGGFANSGHQKMIDHHEGKASEHQDKYTETDGAEGKAHKAAADLHEFAASRHREAFRKLQVNPVGLPDHAKVYNAAKNTADSASEKANSTSANIKL